MIGNAFVFCYENPKATFAAFVVTIAAAVGLILAAPEPTTPPPVVTPVYHDGGGAVSDYLAKYQEMRVKGEHLEINGICASACTYFLNILPEENVCADDHALFGFHGVYAGMSGFNSGYTEFYHNLVYPQRILDLLKEQGFDGSKDVNRNQHPSGMIWLTAEEIEVQQCAS